MVKRVGYFPFVLILLFAFMGGQLVESLSKDEKITSVEASLRSSGVNRKELEKVLHHYQKNPADSLKYKAACFLIENMPFYTYSYGEQLENYKSY